jgi:hypothetical protein
MHAFIGDIGYLFTAIPSVALDIEEGHTLFYQASSEHCHGVW